MKFPVSITGNSLFFHLVKPKVPESSLTFPLCHMLTSKFPANKISRALTICLESDQFYPREIKNLNICVDGKLRARRRESNTVCVSCWFSSSVWSSRMACLEIFSKACRHLWTIMYPAVCLCVSIPSAALSNMRTKLRKPTKLKLIRASSWYPAQQIIFQCSMQLNSSIILSVIMLI